MVNPLPASAPTSQPTCRRCGKPLPPGTHLCEGCSAQLARGVLTRDTWQHTTDILLAVVTFGATNGYLLLVAGPDLFSLPSLIARLILLGLPLAVVVWNWYRLMLQTDPDYGQLWHIYWIAQMLVWVGALSVAVVVGSIVMCILIFL